jgi:hypothetical protein
MDDLDASQLHLICCGGRSLNADALAPNAVCTALT